LITRPARGYGITPEKEFEVAINPRNLFLPNTKGLLFEKQLEATSAYTDEYLTDRVPGAKAVILPATALIQIDSQYLRANGRGLIEETNSDGAWVYALDQISGDKILLVGRYERGKNLFVGTSDIAIRSETAGVPIAVVFTDQK
jgi:hypothetical protein